MASPLFSASSVCWAYFVIWALATSFFVFRSRRQTNIYKKKIKKLNTDLEKLRSLVGSSALGMGVLELTEGKIRFSSCNAALARIYEKKLNTIEGKLAQEVGVPQNIIQEWVKCCQISEKFSSPQEIHYKWIKDLKIQWYSLYVDFLGEGPNGSSQFTFLIENITKRINNELKIIQNEKFLGTILDNLPVSVFCKNVRDNHKYVFWNNKMEEETGIKKENAIGKTDYDFYPIDQADYFRRQDFMVMVNQKKIIIPEVEIVNIKDRKTRVVRTTSVPVFSEDTGPLFLIGIYEDITEKKKMDRVVDEQRAKLENSAKMSSLGKFAAGIAHEINNPLAIIAGRSEQIQQMITRPEIDRPRILAGIEKICQTAFRINKVIHGLQTFSRDGSKDPFALTNMNTMVEDAVELSRNRFEQGGVDLRLLHVPTCQIKCRFVQIAQVIVNLLNNAYDAVHGEENAWVELNISEIPDVNEKGPGIQITVTDSGLGIPPEIASKIMNPFFSTKAPGKGTGLGLSISLTIIRDHAGLLFLDNKHKHTRFVAQLPKDPG